MIATLQQQVNTMLLHQQGSRIEVAKPQVFGGKMEEVSTFINRCHKLHLAISPPIFQ